MMSIVIGITLIPIILEAMDPNYRIRGHFLWIESPTKHTVKSLPFYQALRVVRKRNWHLIDTQPKQKQLTRWEAFKKSVWGNKKGV